MAGICLWSSRVSYIGSEQAISSQASIGASRRWRRCATVRCGSITSKRPAACSRARRDQRGAAGALQAVARQAVEVGGEGEAAAAGETKPSPCEPAQGSESQDDGGLGRVARRDRHRRPDDHEHDGLRPWNGGEAGHERPPEGGIEPGDPGHVARHVVVPFDLQSGRGWRSGDLGRSKERQAIADRPHQWDGAEEDAKRARTRPPGWAGDRTRPGSGLGPLEHRPTDIGSGLARSGQTETAAKAA